ncbi:MAG: fasciclin domain-containing protein [Gemmatimonadota bacterium]|nr:fasciclin domain-containing protein [Gemmatimonadota bacterium]HEU4990339.1 fasciclin domain-containing protein [Gemmatimonadaceae bacterium]
MLNAGTFRTFVTALRSADLVNTLESKGPFTVFAPTDDAFDRLPEHTRASLRADRERWAALIRHHVVPGRLTSADFLRDESREATSMDGRPLRIVARGDQLRVSGAEFLQRDVEGSNGVIHVVDEVLLPEG